MATYNVTYIIGTTHDVRIDALNEDHALELFEQLYNDNDGDIPGAREGEVMHTPWGVYKARGN